MRDQLMILTIALPQQRKNLVLTLVKQRENFAWVCITMVIIVICMYINQRFVNLRRMITYAGVSFI